MPLDLAHRLLHIRINMMHTPAPMTREFLEILKDLYTKKEAWLVGLMPLFPASARVIALLQFKKPSAVEKTLLDLVDRGLMIEIVVKGVQKFMIPVAVPGLFEFQLMDGGDTPLKRKFARTVHDALLNTPELFYGKYEKMGSSFARVIPVNRNLSPGTDRLPYEDARNIIMNAKKFAITNCYCRREKELIGEKTCDAPKDVCMALNFAADFTIKHNLGREVDRETMLMKLDEAEKHNLVHMSDNYMGTGYSFICNCCGCCCGLLGAITQTDAKGPFVLSSMMIEMDNEKCNNCGKCVKVCNVKALSLMHKKTILNKTKCIGCGYCVDVCPQNALKFVPRPGWHEPPKDYGEMAVDLMRRRGRIMMKVPFIRKLAARSVNNIINEANKFGEKTV